MALRFDHVAQQVPDIAAAVTWYRELFPDCEVLYQDESWAYVEVHGTRLAFVNRDQHPNHIAWRMGAAELEAFAKRFHAEIKPHRDGSRSFYLEAPGGQWIELITFPEDG
jgi:catechol 2,3-dioxygenase-like lactoylglutathione lyase family enzyme